MPRMPATEVPFDPAPLSERQAEVFNFLFETVRTTGRQPTARVITAHFGMASPNAVRFHFKVLQSKGWIGHPDGEWGYKILRYPDGRPFRGFLIPAPDATVDGSSVSSEHA